MLGYTKILTASRNSKIAVTHQNDFVDTFIHIVTNQQPIHFTTSFYFSNISVVSPERSQQVHLK